jgi:hypothetical protein
MNKEQLQQIRKLVEEQVEANGPPDLCAYQEIEIKTDVVLSLLDYIDELEKLNSKLKSTHK